MATYKRIKTGDTVKVLSGDHKGKTAKVVKVLPNEDKAFLEGIGERTRHVRANQMNPKGSKKTIHVGIHLSKLKVEKRDETKPKSAKTGKTTKTKKGDDK